MLTFADDIDVVGNTLLTVNDLFLMVETQAEQMGLRINENKTKYMLTSRTGRRDGVGQNVTVKKYNSKWISKPVLASQNISREM